MEIKTNNIDASKREVEFEVSYEEMTPHFDKAFQNYRKKATIPGFRKGKAPISMLKKMHGEAIEYGALEDAANEIFRDYLKDNDVHILGEGSMVDIDYHPGSMFKFKVKYEVKPDFELKKYKGLEITKALHPVDDHVIDGEIKYLRSKHCTYEEADKAVDDEFVLTLDVQKLDETGFPVIGEHEASVKFYLNDTELSGELKEQLIKFSKGEERILTVTNPNKEKPDKYKAKAVKIEKIILPELNEDFFKKIYPPGKTGKKETNTLEEFRNAVKEDLDEVYKSISEQELRNNLISELIKANDIPVPDILVENVLRTYIDDIKSQSPKRELPPDFDKEEYKKTRRVDAILQVKWYLIRDKVEALEKIEVTDTDMEPLIEADSKKYNIPAEKLKTVYQNNSDIKFRILDNKILDFLLRNSKIKETVHKHEHKIKT